MCNNTEQIILILFACNVKCNVRLQSTPNGVTSGPCRTSAPRSLSSSQPTSPDQARLGAAGEPDPCLCPCQTPQLWAGRPTSQHPQFGLRSALSGCSCRRRTSPAWTRVVPLVSSASRLTSASSTTRRLCAGNLATVTSIRQTQSCLSAGVLLSEGFIQSFIV